MFHHGSRLLRRVFLLQPRRFASTRATDDSSKLRNIALVAHIDSGKTTLTESILYKSSYLSVFGTVDTGSTVTDFLPAERERGITIQSASIPVQWKNWSFNLIDTPGHADFGMEVESASRVVDGAVVLIDSVEGVEAQTKGVWRQLDRYGVKGRIIFANKLDRTGASFGSSISSLLQNQLHPKPIVLALPIASFNPQNYAQAEPGIEGIVDLVKWELWKWNGNGEHTVHPLPRTLEELDATDLFSKDHPIREHLVSARQGALETLSMVSDQVMDLMLEDSSGTYLSIPAEDIIPALRSATMNQDLLPVLCGSAMKHIGTDIVLDYVGELFANPIDVAYAPQKANSPLHAFVWKVGWDDRKGWMTFVRIYSGSLKHTASLQNITRNQKEKVSKLLLLYANNPKEVDELPFGSVGVILGLRHTRPGDTLVLPGTPESAYPSALTMIPPPSVMSASIIPNSHSDFQPVLDALDSLSRTDPSVRVDEYDGQILVHGLGALHLEIVEGRLRDEFKAKFEVGKRRVSYREGLRSDVVVVPGSDAWSTEVASRTINVTISFTIRPLEEGEKGDPSWDGNIVVDSKDRPLPTPDSLRESKEAYIGRGIASALSSSPHSSLAMTGLYVRLDSYTIPNGPYSAVLAGGSAYILRRKIKDAGMGPLKEPYIHMRIVIPEETFGNVMKDLTEHGAEILELGSGSSSDSDEYSPDGLYIPPIELSPSAITVGSTKHSGSLQRKQIIQITAPLSQMLDFNNRLRALSGGHGSFEMSPAGFKDVSEGRKMEILKEIGRA